MPNGKPRVLIFDVGFGGIGAALEFEQALAQSADVDVTLVSPIRKLVRRVTFFYRNIESIDLAITRVGLCMGTRNMAIRDPTITWCWPSGRLRTTTTSPAWQIAPSR